MSRGPNMDRNVASRSDPAFRQAPAYPKRVRGTSCQLGDRRPRTFPPGEIGSEKWYSAASSLDQPNDSTLQCCYPRSDTSPDVCPISR